MAAYMPHRRVNETADLSGNMLHPDRLRFGSVLRLFRILGQRNGLSHISCFCRATRDNSSRIFIRSLQEGQASAWFFSSEFCSGASSKIIRLNSSQFITPPVSIGYSEAFLQRFARFKKQMLGCAFGNIQNFGNFRVFEALDFE